MLHLFDLFSESFAFDSESEALCLVDSSAKLILQTMLTHAGKPLSEAEIRLLAVEHACDEGALLESWQEIEQLCAAGIFLAPRPVYRAEQLYPDQARLKALCLNLCHDCNLRCQYCFAGTGDFATGKRSFLSYETGKAAIDFLIKESAQRRHLDIDFFGGEPLLNWDVLRQLCEYCANVGPAHGKDIRLTLTTNATLLDENKIDFINRYFKNCVLSLDGRQTVHDRLRPDAAGRGSFARAAQGIKDFVAKRGQREYYLRGTYTRFNLDFSADFLAMLALAPNISLEPVLASPEAEFALRAADLPAIEREYENLAQLIFERKIKGEEVNFFHFMIDPGKKSCVYKRMKGCGVGSEYCAVTPEGDIYPCHQLVGQAKFLLGNVLQGGLDPKTAWHSTFDPLLLANKNPCLDCWARYYCGGGCAAQAWFAQGSLCGVDEFTCALEKKRLELALWLKYKLKSQT